MRQTSAEYFGGGSARREQARLLFDDIDRLTWQVGTESATVHVPDLKIMPRVGNTPRTVYLPSGAMLKIDDNAFVDAMESLHHDSSLNRLLHGLESRMRYVVPAVILAIGLIAGLVHYGVPALAKFTAEALPVEVDQQLGASVVKKLDEWLFEPSKLPPARQQALLAAFQPVTAQSTAWKQIDIEFRDAEESIGPNALALPSGQIIVTDQLVELAKHDDELVAIIAHEVGHLQHRHSMRMVLQSSAVALLIATVLGDVTSISSLAATAPTLLIYSSYSRHFEEEADDYALAYMQHAGIPVQRFADIMNRLEESIGDGSDTDFLSTHPATSKRISRMQALARLTPGN